MTSLFARLIALIFTVVGVVVYAMSPPALAIANEMSRISDNDMGKATPFLILGVVCFFGGLVLGLWMFFSDRLVLMLLSAIPFIVMCLPVVGMFVQELNVNP